MNCAQHATITAQKCDGYKANRTEEEKGRGGGYRVYVRKRGTTVAAEKAERKWRSAWGEAKPKKNFAVGLHSCKGKIVLLFFLSHCFFFNHEQPNKKDRELMRLYILDMLSVGHKSHKANAQCRDVFGI